MDHGELPAPNTPSEVSGVALPPGEMLVDGHSWVSNGPVADIQAVAARLVEAYPETGLWPVMLPDGFEPDTVPQPEDEARAAEVLAKAWRIAVVEPGLVDLAAPFDETAPPLAAAESECSHDVVTEVGRRSLGSRLALARVMRPADALAAIGWTAVERGGTLTVAEFSSVLRSWETRFGAAPIGAGRTNVLIALPRPPQPEAEMMLFLAEQFAVNPERILAAEGIESFASLLREGILHFLWD